MKNKLLLLLAGVCALATTVRAQVYVCGAFQGWNPVEAVEMTASGTKQYTATIDFSAGNEFKLSTVRPTNGDNAWGVFDSGAMDTDHQTPQMGVPCTLRAGLGNIAAPAHETLIFTVDLQAMTITFGAAVVTDGASGTLPVLYINTDDAQPIASKEQYVHASFYIDPRDSGCEAVASADQPLGLQIRGRGNYTWNGFDKKPYRLKFDEKAKLLGMKSSKHFALMARADDVYGYMRDAVGFELSRRLGLDWTPVDVPCEVIINGKYQGLYFLTETIRVAKDRVNVFEQPDNDPADPTGGWLLEIDNYADDPHATVQSGDGEPIWFTYKTPEELCPAQEQWLQAELEQIDRLIYHDGAWGDYIDLDALARYYIVQEIVDDYESFHGSCYLHRDRGEGQKWRFGPVWDFGSAFNYEKSQFIYQGRQWRQVWIGKMCQSPDFQAAIADAWGAFLADGLDDMAPFVDAYAARIQAAAACDHRLWPQYAPANLMAKAQTVKSRLQQAIAWLKGQWGVGTNGLGALAADTDGISATPVAGGIAITSRDGGSVPVYGIEGRVAARPALQPGVAAHVALPRGIYIVGARKVAVR